MSIVHFDLARSASTIPTPGPDGATWADAWLKFAGALYYTAAATSGLGLMVTAPGNGFTFESDLGDVVVRRAEFADGGGVFGVAWTASAPLITLDWIGQDALRIELDAAWNIIRDFQLSQFTGTQLNLHNWVDVDLRLADAIGRTITLEGAKRGSIRLGDGNDTLIIGVESENNKGGNAFYIATGGGDDTIIIRASTVDYVPGAYDGRWTSTVINAGSGNDTIFGWGSNDSVDGGSGIDTFVLRGVRNGYSIVTANGTTTITDIDLSDGSDGTDTLRNVEFVRFGDDSTLALGVPPPNRPPVAVADALRLGETASASINLLANDLDPDGNALSVTAIAGTAHYGTLSLANGTATYAANADALKAGQTVSEVFTYTLSDGALTSNGTLTVTIIGENDAPVIKPSTATLTEAQAAVLIPALANATDPDGDALSLVSASANSGTVTIDGDAVRYTPAAATKALNTGQSAADVITYTVSDGHTTSTGTIAVTVTGITDAPAGPTPTITVGAGKQYATLAAAVAAAHDGDVIGVAAGTYVNDFATVNAKISIIGLGGMANFVATGLIPNGKGILVSNTDLTIDHLSFSGAAVADANGAGIRYQGGNLVVKNSYFHDNENGILANASSGTITIENSEFSHNGRGDGYTHGIYVNKIANLTITDSYFHDALVGHEIKSRAQETVITNSRIFDGPAGTASYSIDLPNGGKATLSGNVIEQGPHSDNPAIVHFGGEGTPYAGSSLVMTGNEVVNHLSSGSASMLLNQTAFAASISGTAVYGLAAGQLASGPAAIAATTYLPADPPLDTSSPWF